MVRRAHHRSARAFVPSNVSNLVGSKVTPCYLFLFRLLPFNYFRLDRAYHRLVRQAPVNHDVVFLFDLIHLCGEAARELFGEIQRQHKRIRLLGRFEHDMQKAIQDTRVKSFHKRLLRPRRKIKIWFHAFDSTPIARICYTALHMNMPVIKVPKPTKAALAARRAALVRMKGMWKGARGKAILREMKQARKSWDR